MNKSLCPQPRRRIGGPAIVPLLACLLLPSLGMFCGFRTNIEFHNASGRPMRVTVSTVESGTVFLDAVLEPYDSGFIRGKGAHMPIHSRWELTASVPSSGEQLFTVRYSSRPTVARADRRMHMVGTRAAIEARKAGGLEGPRRTASGDYLVLLLEDRPLWVFEAVTEVHGETPR